MHYNLHHCSTLNSSKLSSQLSFFRELHFFICSSKILRILARSFHRSKLFRLLFVVLLLPSFSHALTVNTSNSIHGNEPYLTYDGGRTRAVNNDGLLGITLSDGTKYTPSTNPSPTTPIVLPATGQSFADISMFVPTNTNSVDLNSLIGPPNNYWGDDDGDGDVSATGSLSLSIVDNSNQAVSRNTVLDICKAPYQVKLTSTNGELTTRYGLPPNSTFNESSVTYTVNPKAVPVVCFARPNLKNGKYGDFGISHDFAGPSWMWDPANGFIPQSTDSSRYSSNFPTTAANKMYFDLIIGGVNQALSWSPVKLEGITATMSNSTATSVRVTFTGPIPTETGMSPTPKPIGQPNLPQTFELVGRDSNGNPVVKYGFVLKQWFVNSGPAANSYSRATLWCNGLGYQVAEIKDLTNASCRGKESGNWCRGLVGATPSSPNNFYQRYIGGGFVSEWGMMSGYPDVKFYGDTYWTRTPNNDGKTYVLDMRHGSALRDSYSSNAVCVNR